MITIKHNIPQIVNKLERLKKLVGDKPNWQDDAVNLMDKVRKELERITPKSTGEGSQKGEHLASGWAVKTIGGGGKDRVPILSVVYNRFTHKATGEMKLSARMKTSAGRKNYTLLEILEYGTPPHKIKPVKKKTLRFETRGGEVVFTKLVHHPGTKPYAMVRKMRVKLAQWIKLFVQKWDRRIQSEWDKG